MSGDENYGIVEVRQVLCQVTPDFREGTWLRTSTIYVVKGAVTHALHHPKRAVKFINLAASVPVGSPLRAAHRPESCVLNQLQKFFNVCSGNAIFRSFNSREFERQDCTCDLPPSINMDDATNCHRATALGPYPSHPNLTYTRIL